MDIKMGTRTFLESEVSKTTARPDLYQKMIAVDPDGATQLEHEQRAVTKLRYMQFREQQSSTCSHGFRIEAMKLPGAPPITDLKKVKSHSEVLDTIRQFLGRREDTRARILARLRSLRTKIEESKYFETHEVRGVGRLVLTHRVSRAALAYLYAFSPLWSLFLSYLFLFFSSFFSMTMLSSVCANTRAPLSSFR